MLKKLLAKAIAETLMYNNQNQNNKIKKEGEKLKKKKSKQQMIKLVGKIRYYLSFWFGTWIFFVCNNYKTTEPEHEILYKKFYLDEKIAIRYSEKLKEKYEIVKIIKTYDNHKKVLGYLLIGKVKKATDTTQQPSNVIHFLKYKNKNKLIY